MPDTSFGSLLGTDGLCRSVSPHAFAEVRVRLHMSALVAPNGFML